MGVPKFYRWISERYPCLSEVVKEFQIPDFDNLYLDMNGIIHTCSHPNDDDPHFRISEEKIFAGICHYIDFLFKMIKPGKVFFMAIDGVAPRAKMNQQRGRRFRSAKTALLLEEQAKASGENLPTEARFDSNCITPGTPFMARLHTVLKEFVVYKVSTDKLWQNVRIYLSGHETPGEGEHKIMDFIRYEKSGSNYNPNTRHCLYGLDADLIMLGICSHEPYFCLLREEVKFGGKKNQKRLTTPEETTFHLLHISLLRDYLTHEFSQVKDKLPFEFDTEQIVDDFVLMSFLVGNDFIPHLPQLHIHHDALPVLFKTYIDVLPALGGYINEQGYLNLERFETFLVKLSEYDFQKFGEISEDFQYLEGKSKSKKNHNDENEKINTTEFLSDLGFSKMAISQTAEFDSSADEEDDDEEDSDEECSTLELEFNMHKVDYYINKLEFEKVTPEVMRDQAEGYVRAIQWNLHYYYNGVVSWSWYYPHHYSPYISDVKDFKNMEMNFELGKPFLPFQQLLAVLPKLSKDLLPKSYQKLMCDKDSPLIDYYPDDFSTDLNGKQQEWEAIVLIPFINEKLLLKCTEIADRELNDEERKRNTHGPHLLYTFTIHSSGPAESFLPGYFPRIEDTHAQVQTIDSDFFRLPAHLIVKGLCKGVILDNFILGFPTLHTKKHTATLKNEKVKVFQMVSQKENLMISIKESQDEDLGKVACETIGKIIYVGWPHLREALVVSVSDGKVRFSRQTSMKSDTGILEQQMASSEEKIWTLQVEGVEEHYYQRWGIFVGEVKILVHVRCFTGMRIILSPEGKVTKEKQFEETLSNYALQTTIRNVDAYSPDSEVNLSVKDILPPGIVVFLLLPQYYGSMGSISDNDIIKHKGNVVVDVESTTEPDLQPVIQNQELLSLDQFMPGYIAAQQSGMESHFISRLTGTFLIQTSPKGSSNPNRVNIGLNLKFNRKNEEVLGFSKRIDNQWLYSEEAIKILNAYLSEFADFFENIYKFIHSDIVYLEDIYPDGGGQEVIKKISNWLKSQASSLAERQKCGMKMLDSGIVSAIEQRVQTIAKDDIYHFKKLIKPSQLYCPFLCKGVSMPDPSAKFQLFDRVVNVCHSSSVPLGFKGTIIGIRTAEKESDFIYEIVFDKAFFGGLAISCSVGKGYRLPPSALINISHGERLRKRFNSPLKSGKNVIPRLSRTALFDSALKELQPESLSSPVPAFSKVVSQPSPLQNKPFYKADAFDMIHNHTQDLHLVNQNNLPNFADSNKKQFITPKASRLSGGYSSSPKILPRNVPNSPSPDYQNFWAELKKKAPESPSSKTVTDQMYGQKVSVEELFQGVQNQVDVNQQQNAQVLNRTQTTFLRTPDAPAIEVLLQFCLRQFNAPPLYSYHNYGNTNLHIASIRLPSGENVSSMPCPTKFDATSNAAEKALAFMSSLFKVALTPHNQNYINSGTPLGPSPLNRPVQQPNFQPDYPPPFMYCPPTYIRNFPPPPIFPPFSAPRFDTPLMRHPPPRHSTHIPDSFVKANQMLLLEPEPEATSQPIKQNIAPSTQISNIISHPEREIFHLPGGGTVTIRNTPKVSPKTSDNTHSNIFVPVQVMKQAIKAPHDMAILSNTEWPDLPVKKDVLKKASEECASDFDTSVNERTSAYSEISKCISQTSSSGGTVKTLTPNSNTNLTILKPKSKRIAANFQNP